MNILIIGAGMYVVGREGHGGGTILHSLAQASKELSLGRVVVTARNPDNALRLAEATAEVNQRIGAKLETEYRVVPQDPERTLSCIREGETFDCAIIATPDHLHFAQARSVLRAGLHCLVVKPLTASLDEARCLTRLAEERNLFGAVEFHKRFDESNLYVKRMLDEQRLGQILYFTVDYSQQIGIPTQAFRSWVEQTNIFQYLGVHYVDLIGFFTGFRPVRAMGFGTDGELRRRGLQAFDSVHAQIVWQEPAPGGKSFLTQFATNWIDPCSTTAMSDQKFKVVGTRGRIECDQKNRGIEMVLEGQGVRAVNPYFSEFLPDPGGGLQFSGYGFRSIERFLLDVDALRSGRLTPRSLDSMRPSFRQALTSTAVIEAVNASLEKSSQWVEIHDAA